MCAWINAMVVWVTALLPHCINSLTWPWDARVGLRNSR